ncbi:uncharacterized protein LACBIDRAFT_327853 [Laccaria bicolor S238N-H82]|uniref:Predicted protein n=1 Tax=Laccaria bicolor (strain S238N-H82 / ATCC MYA-4686) TaxID=486041 RepID=B0DD07_LACBS|nr:uncharacterized protein LACBIDRAFT_327853 [Laccaria bicolor S238N-H82]EDR07390.1 predicted protein [Laccaria bicolor S238N-H82]|eukprot:XP_001881782.1 predicted protein [Laccaria bicolor S238N-H82]
MDNDLEMLHLLALEEEEDMAEDEDQIYRAVLTGALIYLGAAESRKRRGHRTIEATPTASFDVALDDADMPPILDDVDEPDTPTNTSGIIVPPKPLAPRPRITDPPPHAQPVSAQPPSATLNGENTTPTPVLPPRRSARLAAVGTELRGGDGTLRSLDARNGG